MGDGSDEELGGWQGRRRHARLVMEIKMVEADLKGTGSLDFVGGTVWLWRFVSSGTVLVGDGELIGGREATCGGLNGKETWQNCRRFGIVAFGFDRFGMQLKESAGLVEREKVGLIMVICDCKVRAEDLGKKPWM
ncbi:hypothetical protein M0R45_030679 [Rubus argutus]|uniref:Uncharacterized protein n=1 Tax=Rubus argutus TaxID=59490 RepID=A0AAW1WC24_RUBAR